MSRPLQVCVLQETTNRALQEHRQLRASYDRLLAAFGAKCAALKGAQDSITEAHEQFRKQLTVRTFGELTPVHKSHKHCHSMADLRLTAFQELGGATDGKVDGAVSADYEKQLAERKRIIDDLRSVRHERTQKHVFASCGLCSV
eukprot:COSAG02_NODE_1645_length_11523_cov_10.783876_8_plen_144_part_00